MLRRFAESHELTTKAEGLASDSENEVAIIINGKLYGQLHGNYMFKDKIILY